MILNAAPTLQDIQRAMYSALDTFLNNGFILEADVPEAVIVDNLSRYLQTIFDDWKVDTHYRELLYLETGNQVRNFLNADVNENDVYPDIVIRHSESSTKIIVIEVSKSHKGKALYQTDEKKLATYFVRDSNSTVGLQIIFNTDDTLGQPYITSWHIHTPKSE